MATIGDGICMFGAAFIILAFMSPIIITELKEYEPSNYEICIDACAMDAWGEYRDLECTTRCREILECYDKNISYKKFENYFLCQNDDASFYFSNDYVNGCSQFNEKGNFKGDEDGKH